LYHSNAPSGSVASGLDFGTFSWPTALTTPW
jgi:hypothetical protein